MEGEDMIVLWACIVVVAMAIWFIGEVVRWVL